MQPSLRVLMVASSYPADSRDWRSRFIADMLSSLSKIDTLQMRFWGPPGDLPDDVESIATDGQRKWLEELMRQGGLAHILRQSKVRGVLSGTRYLLHLHRACTKNETTIDVAHVNWLQNVLALWRTELPAVVTVLGSDYGLLRNPLMALLMRRALRGRRYILAPNATWMVPRLKQMFGDVAEIQPVPFGVEASWYQIQRNITANDKRPWIVISRVTRKKIGPLLEWGENIFRGQDELHILGPNQDSLSLPSWVHYHGPTFPEEIKNRWFPSAAGLVTLSEHDEGRPQVMLEAMAAGVPVIASTIPAHQDVIQNGLTGCLVGSRESLEQAVRLLSNPATARTIGENASNWVRENLGTWQDTAHRYRKLYLKLLEKIPNE